MKPYTERLDGGSRGMKPTLTYQPMFSNASVATAPDLRVAQRLEMERRVRRFLADFSEHCIQTVPVTQRVQQTAWLQDMKRPEGKRNQRFVDQLCDLIALDPMLLAEGIRAEAVRNAPTGCVYEASEKEQAANEALNIAQLQAHREKSRTRWEAVKEYAQAQLDATRRLLDSVHHHLARTA